MCPRSAFLLLAALLLLGACREAKVTSYRAPKDKTDELPPAMSTGSGTNAPPLPDAAQNRPDMAATAVPTASGADLAWSAPARWRAKPPAAMRKGSYAVPGAGDAEADLSITAFPGDVGGELANVNRWRGQIQLPPLGQTDLPAATTRFTQHGLEFVVVDCTSPSARQPTRILGAIVPYQGATWFFKLMGPAATVAAAQPEFLAFLQTVRTPAAAAP